MQKTFTTQLIVMAFLIALDVILTRFLSLQLPIARIGFGFLPLAITGYLFGPMWAAVSGVLGDLLGMMVFPSGQYFPGFTLTALILGAIYGLGLHNKTVTWGRTLITVLIVVIVGTVVLNTLWLNVMYGKAVVAMLPTRFLQAGIMVLVQFILIQLVITGAAPVLSKIQRQPSS